MAGVRTRPMSVADVRVRAESARRFLETARETQTLHADWTDVMASNAVLAGIAASDAICGRVLKVASSGEDHGQAVALLRTATPEGPAYAKELRRLVEIKTAAQYSPATTSSEVATRSLVWAERLVQAMEAVLTRPM
jgi:hypothetical protein